MPDPLATQALLAQQRARRALLASAGLLPGVTGSALEAQKELMAGASLLRQSARKKRESLIRAQRRTDAERRLRESLKGKSAQAIWETQMGGFPRGRSPSSPFTY